MQPEKNKGVTYLLIAAVAVVWGIIVCRVFFLDPVGDDLGRSPESSVTHEPYDQYVVKDDTFKLALNYRDPFLNNKNAPAEIQAKVDAGAHPMITPIKPIVAPVNWGIIKYSGYITNPKTKQLVSILAVNGREQMVAEGESLEGVRLLKNKRDSVLVSWMGKQKYIKQ